MPKKPERKSIAFRRVHPWIVVISDLFKSGCELLFVELFIFYFHRGWLGFLNVCPITTPWSLENTVSHAPGFIPLMSSEWSSIGKCPECGTELRSEHILIAYEDNKVYAECPECGDPVHPDISQNC